MSKRYASCVVMLVEREPPPDSWNGLLVGGIKNKSCQHLQVMLTNLSQKHWEWQENREPMKKHGCGAPDDVSWPKHVANIMEKQGIHGWLISNLLREMSGLQGRATFKEDDTSFEFNRCLRQGSIEAPKLWQMMATQILSEVEKRWKEKWVSSVTSRMRMPIRYAV